MLGNDVREVRQGEMTFESGQHVPVDVVLWTTGATAPLLLGKLGLPKDDRGFLLTDSTLQSTSGEPIFAVGDSGTIQSDRTPKAGVYAVRQGPILWQNLNSRLNDAPLVDYQPQHGFLKLLSTGDGRAIADYKGLSTTASWCWKLKNRIDTRFMAKYQDYEPMEMDETSGSAAEQEATAMRCAGCGGKVGSDVLHRVLSRLDIPASDRVLVGLDQADDAAVVKSLSAQAVMITTDFFTAFVDDPYLVGRIAALNAASDIFALGGRPIAALAMATLPVGPPKQQEQLLFEMLASTWSMVTPCNMHIDQLALKAAAGANAAGGKAVVFNTITISDGISMGTEGMKYSLVSREVIADSIETVVACEGMDGFVAIGGCDKNMPGCMMGMARLNRPSVFVYGGTIMPGCHKQKPTDIVSVFEAVGAHGQRARFHAMPNWKQIECTAIPGPGSCGGMYTANTMASAIEAMGMSLPNSSAQAAISAREDDGLRSRRASRGAT